jgi:dTDP-4-dehydrorhamnose reductase
VKVLLTGAGGQLGRALQGALAGHALTALTHSELDIGDLAAVRDAVSTRRPDVVLNAAAYNDVDGAETHPEVAFRCNAAGPRNLALAAAQSGAAVLHVSTDYVFDGTASEPYDENSPTNPLSVYGRSKLEGENAVRAANPRHYVVRTAWLFGSQGRNFPNTMLRLARSGPVRVVSDQRGSPTYAPHLAEAVVGLVQTGRYGTFHLAGRGGATWFELTQALFRCAGLATAVEPVATAEFPRPAPRPRYSVLTTTQEPRILLPPWEEGVEAFVRDRR